MASLVSTPIKSEDDSPDAGPIGALVIAIPISLLLWGGVVWALLKFVH